MKITLRTFAAITAFLLMMPLITTAAELSKGEKDTIFIGRLKVQPSVIELAEKKGRQIELKRVINSLETQFISALNATAVFQLVERSRKEDLELEQGFAAVAVDPNDKNAAKLGKMAGAKYQFLPEIDSFEDTAETAEYQAIGRASMSRKIFLSALVKIVDNTTGKLLPDSPSIQLSKIEEIENARIGQLSGSDQIIVFLAKEMANKLSQEIISYLRPAKILSLTGRVVMFNRGSESGFKKGDQVEFYAVQEVKDEDSGETFRNEVPVGQGVIERIDKKQSYAKISGDDLGIAKGCVVRSLKISASGSEAEPSMSGAKSDAGNKYSPESTPGSSEKPVRWQ